MLRLGWSGRWPSRCGRGRRRWGCARSSCGRLLKGRLRAEVVRDEYQGSCRYIHLQAECGRLVMRVADREREAVGAALGLDFARVLLFDPASGKRL